MANADPYQYALRQAIEFGGRGDSLDLLRQAVEELCIALHEERVPPEVATQSLVRTASDLLLPDLRIPQTHDLAQQLVDAIERWCNDAIRNEPA
jgi:hypothetical protein